jgi:hypothetical protein
MYAATGRSAAFAGGSRRWTARNLKTFDVVDFGAGSI